jgi:hypothetical protein
VVRGARLEPQVRAVGVRPHQLEATRFRGPDAESDHARAAPHHIPALAQAPARLHRIEQVEPRLDERLHQIGGGKRRRRAGIDEAAETGDVVHGRHLNAERGTRYAELELRA